MSQSLLLAPIEAENGPACWCSDRSATTVDVVIGLDAARSPNASSPLGQHRQALGQRAGQVHVV
jgi:hypothetical protein